MDTNTVPNKGVASLEANLEICQEQARKALARAEAVDPRLDEYGHAATNANADALRFLRMSAKIGLTLAKLKGEHTNNINVRKTETVERAPAAEPVRRKPYVPLASRPPDPEREARVQKIYDDWVAAEAARKARGEDDEDEEALENEEADEFDQGEGAPSEAQRAKEGDPPHISEGSNSEK